ncbi:MAG: response regulator transcription factor [Alphaproteobacteria bacterium]
MPEKKNTLLVIDDEPQIRKMLNIFLDASDFKIEESDSGRQGMRMVASIKPNLVLLDLGLPDIDGKEVVASIRQWSQVPIIILSVRSADDEIAAALNLGADDYVVKPFNPSVLLARINANLRKTAVRAAGEPELINGPVRMDLVRHEIFVNGEKIPFTPREYDLLRYFLINRGKMLTHKQILKEVWGPAHGEDTQYLRVYVGQVREKIEESSGSPRLIITEPGIGYRMETFEDPIPQSSAA